MNELTELEKYIDRLIKESEIDDSDPFLRGYRCALMNVKVYIWNKEE